LHREWRARTRSARGQFDAGADRVLAIDPEVLVTDFMNARLEQAPTIAITQAMVAAIEQSLRVEKIQLPKTARNES